MYITQVLSCMSRGTDSPESCNESCSIPHFSSFSTPFRIPILVFAFIFLFQFADSAFGQLSSPGSNSGYPKSSPRTYSPPTNSPRSYSPPTNSTRSYFPRSYTPPTNSSSSEYTPRVRWGRIIGLIVVILLGLGGAGTGAGVAYSKTKSRSLAERKHDALNNGATWGGPGMHHEKSAGTGRPTYNPNVQRSPLHTPHPSSHDQYSARQPQQMYPPQQQIPAQNYPSQLRTPHQNQPPQTPSGDGPKLPPIIRPPR